MGSKQNETCQVSFLGMLFCFEADSKQKGTSPQNSLVSGTSQKREVLSQGAPLSIPKAPGIKSLLPDLVSGAIPLFLREVYSGIGS